MEIDGDNLVSHLRLTVCLWMKRRASEKLGAGEPEHILLERAGEDRIAVAHDGL
jgi:predicted DNA-binding ribbon-helix-helix protein